MEATSIFGALSPRSFILYNSMTIFALIDCNNFFASCERVFNPALDKKPIVILSSNDGCIIARSNEAKKMGIPMGAPYYQWKNLCLKNQVYVFSSNFELYCDMSHRIMTTLKELCPQLEIYSIDEAFLSLDEIPPAERFSYALHIRKTLKTWTGIPVSIGLGPTKTLAKIANHLAKKETCSGVFDFCEPSLQEKILATYPVENLWGIGQNLAFRLKHLNIHTAKELRDSNPKILRKQFSVVMERLIQELQGTSCLALEGIATKKQIQTSRSFGKPVNQLTELEEALSHYTAKACLKLRDLDCTALGVSVFLHTNLFSQKNPHYANSQSFYFAEPSCDTRDFIGAAKKCLRLLYKPGFYYHKVGVILLDLNPKTLQQADFFSSKKDSQKSAVLMNILDNLQERFGHKALFLCAEGLRREWQVKCNRRSSRYTTQWEELPIVQCKSD